MINVRPNFAVCLGISNSGSMPSTWNDPPGATPAARGGSRLGLVGWRGVEVEPQRRVIQNKSIQVCGHPPSLTHFFT